jgi:hypothetical protein
MAAKGEKKREKRNKPTSTFFPTELSPAAAGHVLVAAKRTRPSCYLCCHPEATLVRLPAPPAHRAAARRPRSSGCPPPPAHGAAARRPRSFGCSPPPAHRAAAQRPQSSSCPPPPAHHAAVGRQLPSGTRAPSASSCRASGARREAHQPAPISILLALRPVRNHCSESGRELCLGRR